MGTLTVRVTYAQGFLHDMLVPTMNVPGLGRHLISGGTMALKEINTVIPRNRTRTLVSSRFFYEKTLNALQ